MAPEVDTHMETALRLASRHHPHPNPRVGAVLVSAEGSVVGQGAHRRRGEPHAEAIAVEEAGDRADGGTLFVTLEPCDHDGATPACTKTIEAAGVARVVVGAQDPDGRVSGRGVGRLRQMGITVDMWDPERAESVDPGYFHHRRTGRPLVTLKLATTLDGQAAAADGSSQWITCEEARRDAHALRSRSDAVLVGAGTLRADDPSLDVRVPGYAGHQPHSVVVAGTRPLPGQARVLKRGAWVYRPPEGEDRVDLRSMLTDLGTREIVDLLVEGGPTLAAALHRAGLVDRYVFYLAGSIAGGVGRPAFDGVYEAIGRERRVEVTEVQIVGSDLRIDCRRGG